MRSIVAVITDFGSRDHYAGALKGAVLAACPEASLVDLSHEIPRHDVAEASWTLLAAFRAFPAGTVFLAAVDVEAAAGRPPLAVEAGGYRFVGPDNGVLGLVIAEHADARVHAVTNRGLFRHEVAATFRGRDVLAPVAGLLAGGTSLDEVGPAVSDAKGRRLPEPRELGSGCWEAEVVHVDRFGNLTTSFSSRDLDAILAGVGGDVTEVVAVVGEMVLPFVNTYSEISDGELCALVGSSGRVEVAVSRGDAAEMLAAGRGTRVRLRPATVA